MCAIVEQCKSQSLVRNVVIPGTVNNFLCLYVHHDSPSNI